MLFEQTFDKTSFTNLISHACSALRLTEEQIKKNFSSYPVHVVDSAKDKAGCVVEIRFDGESATVTCLLDIDRNCETVFIFLDNLCPLTDYENYFNDHYEYDYIKSRWILPDGYLSIKKSKDDFCFMISCL